MIVKPLRVSAKTFTSSRPAPLATPSLPHAAHGTHPRNSPRIVWAASSARQHPRHLIGQSPAVTLCRCCPSLNREGLHRPPSPTAGEMNEGAVRRGFSFRRDVTCSVIDGLGLACLVPVGRETERAFPPICVFWFSPRLDLYIQCLLCVCGLVSTCVSTTDGSCTTADISGRRLRWRQPDRTLGGGLAPARCPRPAD